MNADLKQRWVAALRSGDYAQGQDRLRQGEKPFEYCCLGVLCDLSNLGQWNRVLGLIGHWYVIGAQQSITTLPPPLHRELDTDQINELMRQNDAGTPFTQIADWIEKNVQVQ